MELYQGNLEVSKIYAKWYNEYKDKNCGAFITFTGIVRDEDDIEGLSFDIYEPILKIWFQGWQAKVAKVGGYALFAHSIGDVMLHECSYFTAIITPNRKAGLKLINEFVEDFKANAPIWKYDIKNGERIYAKDRSHKLVGAGILGKEKDEVSKL